MGMNKANDQTKSTPSSNSNAPKYQVQKVVNQRFINGKKEYKIIWTGRTFEEASWQPQENLNCPQKIQDFLKRYQQVIRRKNMVVRNHTENPNQAQMSKIAAKIQPKKISLQKPQNSNQQKLVINQSVNLNKEKLQASLEKNNLVTQKKNQNSEPSKPATTIKIQSEQKPIQIQQEKQKNSSKNLPENVSKNLKQKLQDIESKQQIQAQKTVSQSAISKGLKKPTFIDTYEQDTAQSTQSAQKPSQKTFINLYQRLDIQKINGFLSLQFSVNVNQNRNSLQKANSLQFEKESSPKFFMVKTRFHSEQKVVSKQRIINQQPLKLIEYYEELLMEDQQKRF